MAISELIENVESEGGRLMLCQQLQNMKKSLLSFPNTVLRNTDK